MSDSFVDERIAALRQLMHHTGEPLSDDEADIIMLLSEVDRLRAVVERLRAEVSVLRGIYCEEQKLDEEQAGPCGVCLKCARRERDAALARVAALEAVLAEPSEEEVGLRARAVRVPGWPSPRPAEYRAILRDLRQRAGVVDV